MGRGCERGEGRGERGEGRGERGEGRGERGEGRGERGEGRHTLLTNHHDGWRGKGEEALEGH